MLIKAKFRFSEVFFGALLTVAIFAMGMMFQSSRQSPSNEKAPQDSQYGGSPQAAEKSPNITDWLLVLFNALLFGSTVLLWVANKRSAKIAERALTELERPFIAMVVLRTGLARQKFLHKNKAGTYFGVQFAKNDLCYCFANYGRSPAILLGHEDCLRICEPGALPPPVTADDIHEQMPYGVIVPQGGQSTPSERIIPAHIVESDRDDWREVEHGNKELFLMGILHYQEVSGAIYELKFCAVFDPATERFLMRGGRGHNSHEKVE
jgi:hypothetical protein